MATLMPSQAQVQPSADRSPTIDRVDGMDPASTRVNRQNCTLPFRARRRRSLGLLLLCLGFILAVRQCVVLPMVIQGESMLPALQDGQWTLVYRPAYAFGSPVRGDIVAFWTGTEFMIKRVVGLPGEEIGIEAGRVYVNGASLSEPYVEIQDRDQTIAPGTIPPDCFAVAGDNRQTSAIGIISRGRIVGRILSAPKL